MPIVLVEQTRCDLAPYWLSSDFRYIEEIENNLD